MAVIRPAANELLVTEGADIERLLAVATHPLDPTAMGRSQAHSFPPAKLYIAALGHLLRAYVDPKAWVRQAAFNMTLRRLRLRASPDDIDWIVEQMRLLDPTGKVRRGDPLEFRFSHVDDDGAPRFEPENLNVLVGTDAIRLIEHDADLETGLSLLDLHLLTMEQAFSTFFVESLALQWGEVVELDFEFSPWGFAWDSAVDEYLAIRSPNEQMGDPDVPEPGLLGRLFKRPRPRPADPAPAPEGAD